MCALRTLDPPLTLTAPNSYFKDFLCNQLNSIHSIYSNWALIVLAVLNDPHQHVHRVGIGLRTSAPTYIIVIARRGFSDEAIAFLAVLKSKIASQ